MTDLSTAVTASIAGAGRNIIVPGVVSQIRDAGDGSRKFLVVNGVEMPTLVEAQVGDHVAYVDQAEQMVIGKIVRATLLE